MSFYEWTLSSWWLCLGTASALVICVVQVWLLLHKLLDFWLSRRGEICSRCNGLGHVMYLEKTLSLEAETASPVPLVVSSLRRTGAKTTALVYLENPVDCPSCNGVGRTGRN